MHRGIVIPATTPALDTDHQFNRRPVTDEFVRTHPHEGLESLPN